MTNTKLTLNARLAPTWGAWAGFEPQTAGLQVTRANHSAKVEAERCKVVGLLREIPCDASATFSSLFCCCCTIFTEPHKDVKGLTYVFRQFLGKKKVLGSLTALSTDSALKNLTHAIVRVTK